MIAEPYICIKGPKAGDICWYDANSESGEALARLHLHPNAWHGRSWQPYADFEREKLERLCNGQVLRLDGCYGYTLNVPKMGVVIHPGQDPETRYRSHELIGYAYVDWLQDSESGRLLTRAKFLKAICEKEGVEWLPKADCCCEPDEPCKMHGCERCGSKNTRLDFMFGQAVNHSGIECRDCGYFKRHPPTPRKDLPYEIGVDLAEEGSDTTVFSQLHDRDYYTKTEIDTLLGERKPETVNVNVDTTELRAMLGEFAAALKRAKKHRK